MISNFFVSSHFSNLSVDTMIFLFFFLVLCWERLWYVVVMHLCVHWYTFGGLSLYHIFHVNSLNSCFMYIVQYIWFANDTFLVKLTNSMSTILKWLVIWHQFDGRCQSKCIEKLFKSDAMVKQSTTKYGKENKVVSSNSVQANLSSFVISM